MRSAVLQPVLVLDIPEGVKVAGRPSVEDETADLETTFGI